jgi:hypothetical protein
MHYCINPDETKTEVEKLGHSVTNIWIIKQYKTKLLFSMFFAELKPAANNKDIFNVIYIYIYIYIYTTVQNKIKILPNSNTNSEY